ncbi:MAG: thioredoxin family protein [Cyanobacteria bacterium]|nr:thioredoxin family protein [Cyanobacteriota bacterium]
MRLAVFLFLLTALTLVSKAYAATEGIGWIPSWKQAVAEAKLTNKPILLMAGAPECGGVPGVW